MHSSPYADIIKYSEDIPENLSLLKVKDFLEEMKQVAAESYRVLKKDKFCAVLMGGYPKEWVYGAYVVRGNAHF